MDSMIPLGQKNTLAEYLILSDADNRPPMLDKDQFDFKKSRMELYLKNREHRRMILESVENIPLIWPTVKENGSCQRFIKESSITDARLKKDQEKDKIRSKRDKNGKRDDPIACLNKAMAFLTITASSRFPSTSNKLKTSSNPRNHATIQDGRVIVQQVQGRQGQSYSGTSYKSNATSSGENNTGGHV
nr:hypothetical protein [Tanacetum cinerariifolium]